jgi:hypothetical protein
MGSISDIEKWRIGQKQTWDRTETLQIWTAHFRALSEKKLRVLRRR